jgi:hypothetical protein
VHLRGFFPSIIFKFIRNPKNTSTKDRYHHHLEGTWDDGKTMRPRKKNTDIGN